MKCCIFDRLNKLTFFFFVAAFLKSCAVLEAQDCPCLDIELILPPPSTHQADQQIPLIQDLANSHPPEQETGSTYQSVFSTTGPQSGSVWTGEQKQYFIALAAGTLTLATTILILWFRR